MGAHKGFGGTKISKAVLEDDKSHQEGGLGWDKVEVRCCHF